MYVYLLMADGSDEVSSYTPLLEVCKTKNDADVALMQAKKIWNKDALFICRKRVNEKKNFYVVVNEFEEAGVTLSDFVHIKKKKKRAKGFLENLIGRKVYSRDSLKIQVVS
mgnify:CR=1 FL=1